MAALRTMGLSGPLLAAVALIMVTPTPAMPVCTPPVEARSAAPVALHSRLDVEQPARPRSRLVP